MTALVIPGASRFPFGCATHGGRVRTANEDSYFVSPEAGIFAVADGMGGHQGGALASATVVNALATIGTPVSAADLLARFEDRILRANAELQAVVQDRKAVLGSTVAALLVCENDFACVWSGDSRVYAARGDVIRCLSRDHTQVRDFVERGVLTPDEARTWSGRHVITRAIGVKPEPELEMVQGVVGRGDAFLLCSDGLTEYVDETEMLDHLRRGLSRQDVCEALIALALERGGGDNVTVVVVGPAEAAGPREAVGPAAHAIPGGEP